MTAEPRTRAYLRGLDDGCDELLHEFRVTLQQGRPEVVQEVDHKALDVGAIVILISHDHNMAVPQAASVGVLLVELQAQDLADVVHFLSRRRHTVSKGCSNCRICNTPTRCCMFSPHSP